jgi:hypothetical protein
MTKEKTLREHMRDAARARWEAKTPDERSAHGKMMIEKRWGKIRPSKKSDVAPSSASSTPAENIPSLSEKPAEN